MSDLASIQNVLGQWVKEAGHQALAMRPGLEREIKPDGSIVTRADKAIETWLRPKLTGLVQESTVWGEELGWSAPGDGGLWLIDPIDGTSNYFYGQPLWGISVALMQKNRLVVGAAYLPDLDELYLAHAGGGATLNGETLPQIPPGEIKPYELVSHNDGLPYRYPGQFFPGKVRYTGCIVSDGVFVATQRFRGLIDDKCKLYDVAAVIVMCRELGADVRYADGSPFLESDLLENRRIGKPYIIFPRDSNYKITGEEAPQ